jgi:hypothetical protein
LHDDRRIRIRIHSRIRIREAQKHVDPDPDSDPDPQHCKKGNIFLLEVDVFSGGLELGEV